MQLGLIEQRQQQAIEQQPLPFPQNPPILPTPPNPPAPPPAVRTLTGHRSGCLSIAFHPFGDFVATGSLDTNLKVWDLRRKECIQTYKGHGKGITHVAVSPDGRWVVSGCEAGDVKVGGWMGWWGVARGRGRGPDWGIGTCRVGSQREDGGARTHPRTKPRNPNPATPTHHQLWELSTGRLLRDFKSHTNAITGLEFHPEEFLLTTASSDRTVATWDLETWEQINTIGPEPQPVRAIHYHPDGRELLVATQDGVKVWSVEPPRHYDTVPVPWQKVADMSIYEHRLIGCSISGGGAVGVYVVDLKRVAPFSLQGNSSSGGGAAAAAVGVGMGGGLGIGGVPASPLTAGVAALAGDGTAAVARQQRVAMEASQPPQHHHWEQQQQQAPSSQQPEQESDPEQRQQQSAQRAKGSGPASTTRPSPAGSLARSASDRAMQPPAQQQQQPSRVLRHQRSLSDKGLGGSAAAVISGAAAASDSDRDAAAIRRQRTPPIGGELRAARSTLSSASSSSSLNGSDVAARGAKSSSVGTSVGECLQRGGAPGLPPAGPLRQLSLEEQRQQRDAATSTGGLSQAAAGSEGGGGGSRRSSTGHTPRRVSGGGFPEVEIRVPSHPPPSASPLAQQQQQQQRQQYQLPDSYHRGQQQHQQHQPDFAFAAPASLREDPPLMRGGGAGQQWAAAAPAAASAATGRYSAASGTSSAATSGGGYASAAAPPAPPDPLVAAAAYRPGLKSDLSRSLSTLQVARGFVARGNVEGAYRAAAQAGDAPAAAMLLEALQSRKDAFDVSCTEALVRVLEVCLSGGGGPDQEHAAAVALGVLGLTLRGAGAVIRETLAASAIGVDLNFEARRDKCLVAKLALQGLGMKLGVLARGGPAGLAARAQQLAAELQTLDG